MIKDTETINGVEIIDGVTVHITPSCAYTDRVRDESLQSLTNKINAICKRHPNWKIATLNTAVIEGTFIGEVSFKFIVKATKTRRYEVSWIEHSICYITVEAHNKKEARQLAEENFADDREYLKSTDWKIEEVKAQ